MSRFTINGTAIKYISLFETLTNSKVKDCLIADKIIFIMDETEAGKAIGRNGANVKRLERLTKKRIKIIEFNSDILLFIRNILYPIELRDMKIENNIIYISGNDKSTNGHIIGRDGRNLDFLTNLVKRYFDVKGIRVV